VKNKTFLLIFSSLYLALSCLIYLNVAPEKAHLELDSHRYLEASNLSFEQAPYFPLGYPLFLATIFKIFGRQIHFIVLIQILIALLSGLLLFITTKRLFGNLAGRISFALFSINLGFLIFPQFILIETILVFFLVAFFERFSAYLKNGSYSNLFFACFLLGTSTLFKPAALYFIFPLLLGVVLFVKTSLVKTSLVAKKQSKLRPVSLIALTLALAGCYGPISAYVVGNGLLTDSYSLTRLESQNVFLWLYPKVQVAKNERRARRASSMLRASLETPTTHSRCYVGPRDERRFGKFHKTSFEVEQQRAKELVKKGELSFAKILKEDVFDSVGSFFLYVKIALTEVFKTFFGPYLTNLKILLSSSLEGGRISFFKTEGKTFFHKIHNYISAETNSYAVIAIGYFELAYIALLYLLAFIGIFSIISLKRWGILYLITSYVAYFSIITCCDGYARYRMPFEFILIMLAAKPGATALKALIAWVAPQPFALSLSNPYLPKVPTPEDKPVYLEGKLSWLTSGCPAESQTRRARTAPK